MKNSLLKYMRWLFKKLIISILDFIGSLYRDFIVFIGKDFVEYSIKGGYFVYKSRIPVNITIGRYKFLKEKDFNKLFNSCVS